MECFHLNFSVEHIKQLVLLLYVFFSFVEPIFLQILINLTRSSNWKHKYNFRNSFKNILAVQGTIYSTFFQNCYYYVTANKGLLNFTFVIHQSDLNETQVNSRNRFITKVVQIPQKRVINTKLSRNSWLAITEKLNKVI